MKREIAIRIRNGNIVVDSSTRLKDIASTLPDGNYVVSIEEDLSPADAVNYRKRFFSGVDTLVYETGNQKTVIVNAVKRDIINKMINSPEVEHWIDLARVQADAPFSLTWLTPRGWNELYIRFRLWAFNMCNCYV